MQHTTLGRTELRVGVAGLGCGGFSRLGLGTGKSEADAIALIRQALDLGVTLLDTAAIYDTEAVVGAAIKPVARDSVVITTKSAIHRGAEMLSPETVIASLDQSLRRLNTDYVDAFLLHGVPPSAYGHAKEVIVPALLREKQKGKFRHLGITETAPLDPTHVMLDRAMDDDIWDVAMVGFHMMHQNARNTVFPRTLKQRVGTLMMFAVRNIFSRPERLAETMRELVASGELPDHFAHSQNPLDFLIHDGGADSLTDAAYRYVRHEPGADVVLFGTGDTGHLRTNIASILKPPLPEADRKTLAALFGRLVGVGLDRPGHATPAPSKP
jgi:aryl-alcohol dehydrogenase-like predicted oxidoreductase